MALALADSIASVGRDPDDQARCYLAWWRKGKHSVILFPRAIELEGQHGLGV
jgi:hypothetical protein